jgi:hypothetical protein
MDGDEGHAVVIVDRGEIPELLGTQIRFHPEEPEVGALRADPLKELPLPVGILGTNGPEVDDPPILEQGIELELLRVFHLGPSAHPSR